MYPLRQVCWRIWRRGAPCLGAGVEQPMLARPEGSADLASPQRVGRKGIETEGALPYPRFTVTVFTSV